MSKLFCFLFFVLIWSGAGAQVEQKLATAWNQMINSDQLAYAAAGICVLDATSGKEIFSRDGKTGFAPASTTKVLTSIAAFDALQQDFRYHTKIYTQGTINNGSLQGNIIIEASGDPSFGSWRFVQTKNDNQLKAIADALKKSGIKSINGNIVVANKGYDINPLPPYWPWGDIGNYYGAGIWPLNWNENQYDFLFATGKSVGSSTKIVGKKPANIPFETIVNEAVTGYASTGDQSVIYTAPFAKYALVQGKLQANENRFTVSGAVPDGEHFMLQNLQAILRENGIALNGKLASTMDQKTGTHETLSHYNEQLLIALASPPLDSLVYWFMKKSINLYGEAFVRTIGLQQKNAGTTENGIEWMEQHYKNKGLDIRGMHLTDGSGLSPTNRIAPFFLCEALRYARGQAWFPAFEKSFPEYNGMNLKSGTIHRVKCFAGYHGKYVVAIMVNNYNGSSSAIVSKMYNVLNALK